MRIPKPMISRVERLSGSNHVVVSEELFLSNLYGKGQPGVTLLCRESEIQDEFDSYLFVKGIRYSKIIRGVEAMVDNYPIMLKTHKILYDSLTDEGIQYFSNTDLEVYVHYGTTFIGKNFGTLCFEKLNNCLCFRHKQEVSKFQLDALNSVILEVLYSLAGGEFNGVKSSFFKDTPSIIKLSNSIYSNKNFGKGYVILGDPSVFTEKINSGAFSKYTLNVIH